MKATSIDTVLQVRPQHEPGTLARVAATIILALSNPEPEIEPKVALAAGAALASDGRAINNALAFPGLMRGAIEARVRTITPEMMILAAQIVASRAEPGELVPAPLDLDLHEAIVAGVIDTRVSHS